MKESNIEAIITERSNVVGYAVIIKVFSVSLKNNILLHNVLKTCNN